MQTNSLQKKQREKEAKKLNKEKAQAERIESSYGRTQNGNKPFELFYLADII